MMKLNNKFQTSNYNLKSNKNKRESIVENVDVFGKELRLLVEARQLPELICMLGYMIKNWGVRSQGLFRVSGNKTRMEELRTLYTQSRRLEVGMEDIHNVTGLFKSFLREIPGGVIPCPQSLDLIKATRMYKRNENLDLLINELLKLPVPHYNLLKFTCSLLNQVSQSSVSNLMTSENLGTVFGPTFFSSVEDMSLLPTANCASMILIQNFNDLFKVSAPVHTNLNQNTENVQGCNDITCDCTNGCLTKSFAENITAVRFGQSCLLFNSNGETDNSMFSYSIHDEEPIQFPDNFHPSHSFPGHSQFSNSLDMTLRMCLTNHLFTQFQETEYLNMEPIFTPRLISDVMLNPHNQISLNNSYNPQIRDTGNHTSQYPSNLRMKSTEKKKTVEELSLIPLPRKDISLNSLQNNFAVSNRDQKSSEILLKSDSSQTSSEIVLHNETDFEKPSQIVPQLDLSILYEIPGSDKILSPPQSKSQEIVNKYKSKNSYDNTHCFNVETKTPDNNSPLNLIKENITNLKNQLRQFEDQYYASNGVRPDKLVRTKDEWYSRTLKELKLLRQEKEQFINANETIDDYDSESIKNVKRKTVGASGDIVDKRSNTAARSENRSVLSRPVSALSETPLRVTPNESGRSNTLNQPSDLSSEELDNLKIALEKISGHLIAERIRDNRPNDLESMTQQQIETEKVSMQKALLNFESTYGRKKTPHAVQLMRPLYDRYRQVKKRLSQINETQGLEWKITQRTLDSHGLNQDMLQSAWTSEKPLLNTGLQSLKRNSISSQANNRIIHLPITSHFEINEDSVLQDTRPNADLSDNKSTNNSQSQRKNVRTIQYRRTSVPLTNDNSNNNNNNKRISSQKEERVAELQQLLAEKKELQRALKDFENNFERERKRKVEKLDRLPMEREYNRYKIIKNRIKELEELFELFS